MRCDVNNVICTCVCEVSIHTPTWGVTTRAIVSKAMAQFQSTHLHEVWRLRDIKIKLYLCFNPHTYMRCDVSFIVLNCPFRVSIHTPTWGVTKWCYTHSGRLKVSIHTPTWGVTASDPNWWRVYGVSIHTPTWGVTHSDWRQPCTIYCFNPHTYMRCDLTPAITPPSTTSFNPHTYMRCDRLDFLNGDLGEVSIHTPTWGVTADVDRFARIVMFQSTHLHEVWLNRNMIVPGNKKFQSTHLHEVWPVIFINSNI